MDDSDSAERRRVGRAYAHYAASSAKQRSWSAENPGNVAIRAELGRAMFALAGPALGAARAILDVGCGSGWWLQQLASDDRIRATMHGLEVLPDRAEAARKRVPDAVIAIGDARRLPYSDHSFDVVSLLTTLSSLATPADAELALREAWRVLAPRGVLLIWEPRVLNPLNPKTLFISRRLVRRSLGGARTEVQTTSVLPALSRHLGSCTARFYPRLARIRALRTHRLVIVSRDAAPLALVLVRNTVSHDARVLREADTLRRLGCSVLIAGVVSTTEREQRLRINGAEVVRLDPAGALRTAVRRLAGQRRAPPPNRPISAEPPPSVGATAGERTEADGFRRRVQRLGLTGSYNVQGAGLAWRAHPAIVHANDYNTMWIGIAAKLLRGSRLIYDSHELWPDRNGRPEWRPWLIACEALFVRVADATITASPGYAGAIAQRYRVPPPVVVRNIPAERKPRFQTAPRAADDGSIAVYVGGLMPGRGLEPAIRALALAPELRLRLIGPGSDAYRARLRDLAVQAGVGERVELQPPVPPATVVDAIADADLGLMLIEPICRSYELTVPNKLFEYAAAELPILSSNLPVIGPLVEAEQLGAVVPADDIKQIARAMQRLAEPAANTQARARVRSFAQRVTWERERETLERVYARSLTPASSTK